MINKKQIEKAQNKVADEFESQCTQLAQNLPFESDIVACGQYLRDTSMQRGGHGTASALYVLGMRSTQSDKSRTLVQNLVSYAMNRQEVEAGYEGFRESAISDTQNIIKKSELLYSLCSVPSAVASTEQVKASIAEELKQNRMTNGAWGYWTNNSSESDTHPLPTAFAVKALTAYGIESAYIQESMRYLREVLPKTSKYDVFTRILVLFVLSFSRDSNCTETIEVCKKAFSDIWKTVERMLTENVEQTVEYRGESRHHYVRLPWQLYLVPLAAKYQSLTSFFSRSLQKRLQDILNRLNSDPGFYYEQSGTFISSRTYSILYECLDRTKDAYPDSLVVKWVGRPWNALRSFFGSIWGRGMVSVAALGVIGWSAVVWYMGNNDVGDIAPSVFASVLVFLALFGKQR